jgi:hypothetical protein
MLLHRPLRKLRHVLSRFETMEQQVVGLREQLVEAQSWLESTHHVLHAQRSTLEEQRSVLQVQHDLIRRHEEAADRRFVELRDSTHLAARRGFVRRPARVLFLVHLIEAWDSCHEVVEAMRAAGDFQPIVASIPRRFPGATGFAYEDEVHEQLERRGVSHIRLPANGAEALRLVKAIDPDLVFRQSQWDADIPEELGTDRLTFARLCLIPYETMNLVQNLPGPDGVNSAVDSPLHRASWTVFCTNDLMLGMAQADGALAGGQFRVTGHPKADRIRTAAPSWPLPGQEGTETARPRVVWSAHHSIGTDWSNFGTFPAIAEDMFAWAAEDAGTEFTFMPHPVLFSRLNASDSPFPRERLDEWLARWNALPNTALFTDGDYAPILTASDLMLTDGLSMLVEYQLLQRPVIFLERPDHRPFTPIGEMVRTGTHPVESVPAARSLAERFLRGERDPLAARQRANVHQLFGEAPSVPRILGALRGMLDSEEQTAQPRSAPHPARIERRSARSGLVPMALQTSSSHVAENPSSIAR